VVHGAATSHPSARDRISAWRWEEWLGSRFPCSRAAQDGEAPLAPIFIPAMPRPNPHITSALRGSSSWSSRSSELSNSSRRPACRCNESRPLPLDGLRRSPTSEILNLESRRGGASPWRGRRRHRGSRCRAGLG
jgi:hypothetical protein